MPPYRKNSREELCCWITAGLFLFPITTGKWLFVVYGKYSSVTWPMIYYWLHLSSSLERGRLWMVCSLKTEYGSIPDPFQSFPTAESSPNSLPQLDKPTLKTTQKISLSKTDKARDPSWKLSVYALNFQTMVLHWLYPYIYVKQEE